MRYRSVLAGLALLSAFCASADEREQRRVEYSSYHEIDQLFEELNYTPESWRAGIREVPRVYLTHIPPRWSQATTKEITVQHKKRLFFRAGAPIILKSNELITADRERLLGLGKGGSVPAGDREWLAGLAERYGVEVSADPDAATIDALLARVDIVPVSLALSQAAEESGWGTSRFAREGNAIFGQWTYGGKGIKPKQQRAELGDHRIAAFDSPFDSVQAYMSNLNTHRAYEKLRARRAELRRNGEPVSGWELAKTLDRYSERGQAYVDTLHAIMRVNHLAEADEAYLGDGPAIYLVPVGEGAGTGGSP